MRACMRDETPSRTAAWVALSRHAGRLLPHELQLADDPYGAAFASPLLAKVIERGVGKAPGEALVTLPPLLRWILYMQIRTRVIDDAVRAFVDGGGRQLVLLGAGYDCRALRLPELADTAVFEVDHPATQQHKRRVLDRLGVDSPSTYVTWHFEERPMAELPAALATQGHDPAAPTLTIWEGVTMYLTPEAIDASLRAIAAFSAPHSQLAMTYFTSDRLRQPSLVTRAISLAVSGIGEPWRFGWDPGALPGYLQGRGFELVDDVSLADAARAHLPASAAALVGDDGRRIATSAVETIAIADRSS